MLGMWCCFLSDDVTFKSRTYFVKEDKSRHEPGSPHMRLEVPEAVLRSCLAIRCQTWRAGAVVEEQQASLHQKVSHSMVLVQHLREIADKHVEYSTGPTMQ